MKLDLSGRERTDIGPLIRSAWAYGETIELSPGTYYSSPQVLPGFHAWNEARAVIVGSGDQGTEISPLPGIEWKPDQPMWLFTGGRSRVTNLMLSDHNTSHQRTFLQFGDGTAILANCYAEALDMRQYRRGIIAKKVDGMYVRRVDALGSEPGADVQAHTFLSCNGVVGEYNWTEGGGRHVLWKAVENFPGLNEGFNWTGDGCAEVDVGIEMHGGNNILLGDEATSIDCRVGGVGIKLVGTPDHPLVRATIKGWLGGNSTKAQLIGPGVMDVLFDNTYFVSNKRFGREDGIVLIGDAENEPWKGLQGGVWRISTRGAQFRGLGCGIVEHQWQHRGAQTGVMPVDRDSATVFDDCLEKVARKTVVAAALLLCIASAAFAHDHAEASGAWIGKQRMTDPKSGEWCCNEKDCFAESVSEFSDFILVNTGEMIPTARVIWRSADGQWWRCRVWMNGEQRTRCLIGPPRGL